MSEQTDFGSHVQPGRYVIRPESPGVESANLEAFEGKRIAIRGNLLPGDRFIIDRHSIEVLGPCTLPPEPFDKEQFP